MLEKLKEFVAAQGGDAKAVEDYDLLPKANIIEDVISPVDGYVLKIECDEIGMCSLLLGGGRETKESAIDLSVGMRIKKKVGDSVKKGECLATIYANEQEKLNAAKERFLNAYTFGDTPVQKGKFIKGIIR